MDQLGLSAGMSLIVLDRLVYGSGRTFARPHEHRYDSTATPTRDLRAVNVGLGAMPAKQIHQQVGLNAAETASLPVAPVGRVHQLTRVAQRMLVAVANRT